MEDEKFKTGTNHMKVRLKKSVEDYNWGGEDYDILTLNPISRALTNYYLPQWSPSPLKAMLLQRFGTIKQLFLYLRVRCKDDIVQSISLECSLLDDFERAYCRHINWDAIRESLATYFHSIGYAHITCTNEEDILHFIQRMQKDIPLTENYFEIIEK